MKDYFTGPTANLNKEPLYIESSTFSVLYFKSYIILSMLEFLKGAHVIIDFRLKYVYSSSFS